MIKNFYYSRGKLFYTLSLIFLFTYQSMFAAGFGTIKGRVIDKATGDGLAGANIVVQNTSLGAASDLDGYYIIRNVPDGRQTLTISYIGYVTATMDVSLVENQVLEQEITLSVEAITGETVVVTAQATGQIAAINQQLTSNTIKNVVSEKRIQELPDFNAAEAIGRLPGVSTQRSSGEGNKVIIRGLSPKHNLIAINGMELGATGSNDRSVDLTMITPNMLQTIEVFKALTPDMDADAIGGYVNMKLREAPADWHTDILWQSGYTKFNSKYSNYKAVGSVSNRFMGNDLGVFLLGDIEQVDRSSDNFNAAYDVNRDAKTGEQFAPITMNNMGLNRHLETRARYGANLMLDYKLPSGKITMINFFSRLKSDYTDYTTNRDVANNNLNYTINKGNNNTDLITNALQGDYDFGIMNMDFSIANNYSRNNDPEILAFNFRMEAAYPSLSNKENIGPEGIVGGTKSDLNLVGSADPDRSITYLQNAGRNSTDYKENSQTISTNFTCPFNLENLGTSGYFKVGGKYKYIDRNNNPDNISAQIFYGGDRPLMDVISNAFPNLRQDATQQMRFYANNFTDGNSSLWTNFLDDRFSDLKWVPNTGILYNILDVLDNIPESNANAYELWYASAVQLLQNDYNYKEKFSAGYAMTELNFGTNLMLLGGVRYENSDREFKGYQMWDGGQFARINQGAFTDTAVSKGNNHYLLPMVHSKYKLTDWIDVRYAFTKTLSRPDFIALTPAYFVNNSGNYVVAGNPNLKPAQSTNHDLIFSFYENTIGLFTLGGFYKNITDFVWQTSYPLLENPIRGFFSNKDFLNANKGATLQTWNNNKYKAEMYGIEVDWQTRFWYLPFPINGVVLNINYTHIWSNTKYPRAYPIKNSRGILIGVIDSFRIGRVENQPADILNASFGYDYEGFSGRISFLFQGKLISYVGRREEVDSRTKDYLRIDAAIRQKLPLEGFQMYLNLNNLNQRKDEAAQSTMDFPTNQQYYGFTADLGIRYTL